MESMTPENAVQAYLDDRKHDLAESSHQNHESRLQRFLNWCEENGVIDMSDVSGKRLNESTGAVFDPRICEAQLLSQRCEEIMQKGAVFVRTLHDEG